MNHEAHRQLARIRQDEMLAAASRARLVREARSVKATPPLRARTRTSWRMMGTAWRVLWGRA